MSNKHNQDYILKYKEDEELFRLGFQHQVWKKETDEVLQKAGFKKNQTLLDLGCGPGYLSFELSEIVGPKGRVIALDNSSKFINHLNSKILSNEFNNITAKIIDITEIHKLNFKPESIDGAIARWLFMFVKNSELIFKQVSRLLKPNGIFAVIDYFQFRSMSLFPGSTAFTKIYNAVYELIKIHGGNADRGGEIPELMVKNGLKIKNVYPIFRFGKTGSPLWNWLEITSRNHDNLVEAGLIKEEELNEYYQDWSERAKDEHAFITAPPILVTIAMKSNRES
jgi:ubiquinone/menaquinone biosynthesis C-methylase UbiE